MMAAETATGFSCLRCGRPISRELVIKRISRNPPGECQHCGSRVILEASPGSVDGICAAGGVRLAHVRIDPGGASDG